VSFKSTSNSYFVATRRLQLTVKKTVRAQKTLDGSLQIVRHGERESVSSRIAELDQLIPQYLGVSKAVLEYVIFCHQDDSLWPMSEPSVLKKRFDEIFEAMKYTKAIDNIKILRKKQNEELGKLKIIEQHAKEDKLKGDRSEKRSTELFDEIEVLRGQVEEIERKIDEAEEKAKEAFDHASRFEQIVAQLNGKRITLKANEDSAADLELNLKQMAESDEQLQAMLDQYEERVSMYDNQKETLREQYSNFKHDLDENRASLGRKQGDIGKFQAEAEQYERQVQKRENLIKEAARRHGIRGFDFDITDKQIAEFLGIVGKMSRDQERSVNRARQEAQEDLRKAQGGLNQLNDRKAALNQSKETSRSQIAANDKRISDLQHAMDRIQVDEGGEATLKEKKNETEQRLKGAISDAKNQGYDEQIQEADTAARLLDEKKEQLEAEMVQATKLARETAQIEYAQDELKAARHGLQTMKEVHGNRISKLIEPDWEPASLEAAFQRVLSQKGNDVKEAESRRDIAQTNLGKIVFRINNLEAEQKKKRVELEKYEQTVLDATQKDDIADFEETLQELEEQYDIASTDNAKFQASMDYFRGCLKAAQEDNQCRLCRRALRDNKAENFTKVNFISQLEGLIEKAERNMSNAENVDQLLEDLDTVRSARPSYELAVRLRKTDLPALQSEINKLASERDAINKQLEDHDSTIAELQEAKHEVESLSKDVQALVNYWNQTRDLERKIQDLSEKQQASGSSRGIDAVQQDLKKVGEEAREARGTLNRLTGERDKLRSTINMLELRIRDINAELSSAQSKLKEKRALAERIEEYKSQNAEQREAVRGIDRDLQGLIPQLEQAQAKYDDINRRGNEHVQRLQSEASKLSDTVRQLSDVEEDINAYIDKGGPKRLERAHREIESLEAEISRIETDMVQVTRQLKQIEDTVRDTEATKRCIGDNIRYRKAKRSLDTLRAEIQELESHNAEQDKERYEQEGRKWQNAWNRLSTQRASLHGTIKTKDDTLKDLIEEWETEYKDAAIKYREAHIRVETTKAAVEDLGRYGGALDKAIMKYHTLKMEEINQIIEELWKHAYQGTDVDTIRIRSDNETAKGNRSYNYRVVMVKQDVEMDMRGRCSAGQKVLASIVIRLALAECFGTNCGIIALDEPTTNLDQQNITGLAEALSEIIKIRRKQANFQLIVITHDEQFLKAMNCADYADVYYRVGRNEDQKSIIERQHISEVSVLMPCAHLHGFS
jgi:DNA repair protein RAD50